MMKKPIKYLFLTVLALVTVTVPGCGADAPAKGDDASSSEASTTLTDDESMALEEAYVIEALETIDETNAESELEKLTQEIEADQ